MLEMSQIDKIFIKGQLCRMETKVCPLGFFFVWRFSFVTLFDIFDERGENLLRYNWIMVLSIYSLMGRVRM